MKNRETTASDSSKPRAYPPLMRERTSRRLFASTFIFVALVQLLLLIKIGNGLSSFDTYDEADTVRAAQAFAKEGFTSHHGLARLLYGNRFPNAGAVIDHIDTNGLVKPIYLNGYPKYMNQPNEWVYMHYPPGSELLSGVSALVFGTRQIWLWRLVPISFGMIAIFFLYRTLGVAFGPDRSALVTLACVLLPMTQTFMPGLFYESYSLVFQLFQFSFLIHLFWRGRLQKWRWIALFFLGFFQGWLSFDLFFVVCFAAIPLWLMRRAEGSPVSFTLLCLSVCLPATGFGFAHFLHLLQIAGELGGLKQAVGELTHTAIDRAGVTVGMNQFSYLQSFSRMSFLYVREFLRPYNLHFGPFLILAIAAGIWAAIFRSSQLTLSRHRGNEFIVSLSWPGPKKLWPTLITAFCVCASWPIVMPGANVGNFHIYPRDFFFFYFVLVLALVKSVNRVENFSPDSSASK